MRGTEAVRSRSKRNRNSATEDAGRAPGPAGQAPAGQGIDDRGDGPPAPAAPAPAKRRRSSRSLKNWRVRSRLLLLIAIPTLTAVALGGVRIASSIQSAAAYQRVETLAGLGQQIIGLSQNLEDERDQTAYYIGLGTKAGPTAGLLGDASAKAQLQVVRSTYAATDQSQAKVQALVSQIGSSYSAQTRQQAASALSALSQLQALRQASVGTQLPVLVVVQKYQQMISNVLALNSQIAQGVGDPTLAQTVVALGLVSAMKEDASEQRAILTAALLQGGFGKGKR